MFFMDSITAVAVLLLSVAFFTLMERKLMGLSHYRKGPNKVVSFGLTQPIADAVKLMTKEYLKLHMSKNIMLNMGPLVSILLMMVTWSTYEFSYNIMSSSMKVVLLFAIMSMSIYGFILMSWGSNSKYSMLGGNRAVAQTMSYEVCMFLVVLAISYLWFSYSSSNMSMIQQGVWMMLMNPLLFLTWVMLCMAEANRTPFDTAEGESELVSGFNLEYGGGLFALIFISEYGMMIMLSFLTSLLFIGAQTTTLKTMLMMMVFIWTRCSFPRVRYDILMQMAWKVSLPAVIAILSLSLLK